MTETFDVELTKADYSIGLMALMQELARRDPNRSRALSEQVLLIGVLFTVLMLVFMEAALPIAVSMLSLSVVLAAAQARWARKASGASFDTATAAFTAKIDDAGVTETAPGRVRRWDWSAVRFLHEVPGHLVFEMDGWDMLILPAKLWPDDAARDAFAAAVRERIPPRADRPAEPPMTMAALDHVQMSALAAGVDVTFLIVLWLPTAAQIGTAAALAAVFAAAIAGWFAYRLARPLVRRLHAASPLAVTVIGNLLIFMVPAWFVARGLGWI